MEAVQGDPIDASERSENAEFSEKRKSRAVEELLKLRSDSEITIEATVDTGLEFMAIEECKDKFGKDFQVLKERGSIFFNIEKSKYPEVRVYELQSPHKQCGVSKRLPILVTN